MTKQEAIQSMREGNKLSHRYFDKSEWVTMKDGRVYNEDGYSCTPEIFWGDRQQPFFQIGWELFK